MFAAGVDGKVLAGTGTLELLDDEEDELFDSTDPTCREVFSSSFRCNCTRSAKITFSLDFKELISKYLSLEEAF